MPNRRPPHWDEPLSPLCEHSVGSSCKHCRGVFPFPREPLPHQTGYRLRETGDVTVQTTGKANDGHEEYPS